MILVTGGAGFIGSNIVAALEARGESEVIVCDRLRHGEKWRNLAKREIADFVHPDKLFDFLNAHSGRVRAIFHMGAISATTETDADLILNSNFKLTMALWDWCAAHRTRLFYASSAATYGDGAQGFDDAFGIEALARLRPLNAYGWSKHIVDRRIARLLSEGRPAPAQWAGLKFFNVYGPNETHKGSMKSVVAQTYPVIAAGNIAKLFRSHRPDYHDGGQLRDFVAVEDCVAVMMWLLDHPETSGLFNLGTGKARSFKDLATAVFTALSREPRIEYVDTPIEIRAKYQYFTEAGMTKLREAGYDRPFRSLEEGVRAYVQDYLAAADPYR